MSMFVLQTCTCTIDGTYCTMMLHHQYSRNWRIGKFSFFKSPWKTKFLQNFHHSLQYMYYMTYLPGYMYLFYFYLYIMYNLSISIPTTCTLSTDTPFRVPIIQTQRRHWWRCLDFLFFVFLSCYEIFYEIAWNFDFPPANLPIPRPTHWHWSIPRSPLDWPLFFPSSSSTPENFSRTSFSH